MRYFLFKILAILAITAAQKLKTCQQRIFMVGSWFKEGKNIVIAPLLTNLIS